MNTNVAQLLLVLTAGIGGTAAAQATLRRRDRRGPRPRPLRLGEHIMRSHEQEHHASSPPAESAARTTGG
ncbi:hypothetical protein [Rhodococcus sp. NPDC003348]